MAEYIEREAALKILTEYDRAHIKLKGKPISGIVCIAVEIGDIPAADVRPVVRGKWRLGGYGQISDATVKWYDKFLQGGFFYCSNCKERSRVKTNFCPNCGADMREES